MPRFASYWLRPCLVLLTVLLRLNSACEEQEFHLLYQVFHPWLRLVLVPETPCNSISSVSHTVSPLKHKYGMHTAQVHTNLMNSRTSTITHFVEHSTRLYDCKSYIWIAFTNWWPKMILYSYILTIICFPAGSWTTTSSRRFRQEYFQISLPWIICK